MLSLSALRAILASERIGLFAPACLGAGELLNRLAPSKQPQKKASGALRRSDALLERLVCKIDRGFIQPILRSLGRFFRLDEFPLFLPLVWFSLEI